MAESLSGCFKRDPGVTEGIQKRDRFGQRFNRLKLRYEIRLGVSTAPIRTLPTRVLVVHPRPARRLRQRPPAPTSAGDT